MQLLALRGVGRDMTLRRNQLPCPYGVQGQQCLFTSTPSIRQFQQKVSGAKAFGLRRTDPAGDKAHCFASVIGFAFTPSVHLGAYHLSASVFSVTRCGAALWRKWNDCKSSIEAPLRLLGSLEKPTSIPRSTYPTWLPVLIKCVKTSLNRLFQGALLCKLVAEEVSG